MLEYIKIANKSDFANISIKSYSLFGKKIGIIKRDDGSFYAIDVACKHQGADLTTGQIVKNIATCPRHKWQYDLVTGECLNHDSPVLKRYPLKLENDSILVSLTSEI